MNEDQRTSLDAYYAKMTDLVSSRGTCPKARVGAVVVSVDGRVLSTGYNGAPRGLPHCEQVGCFVVDGHCVRAVHAEVNAILNLENRAVGGSMYVTHVPCVRCAAAIAQSGIGTVTYYRFYGPNAEYQYVRNLFEDLRVLLRRG